MAPRTLIPTRVAACAALLLSLASPVLAGVDPVAGFRAAADSLIAAGDDDALQHYVSDHAIIVGSVVGALLDDAFLAVDDGAERALLDAAERIARLHAAATGSSIPLGHIERYRSWSDDERAIKRQAQDLENQVDVARQFQAFDRAVELLEQAQALYRQIDDERALAVTWGSLGVAHWYRADMAAVEASYERALEARRAVEDRILEGRTLNGLGSTSLRAGRYDRAVDYYRRAIDLRRETGDLAGLGTSLTYLGNCYYQMNRLVDARDYFEQALSILERVGEGGLMIEILNSVANLYSDMNRLQAANNSYRRAIDIAIGANLPRDEATCRINLAGNLSRASKYSEALDQLDIAAARLEEAPEPFRLANLYSTRVSIWVAIGELDRAREDLMELLPKAGALGDPAYAVDAQLMTATVYFALGANDRALAAAEKAIASAESSQLVRAQRDGEAMAARIETRNGNYESALAHWRAALAVSEAADAAVQGSEEARLGIAGVLALQGRREEARTTYRELLAAASARELLDEVTVAHSGIAHTFEEENPDSAAFHYGRALAAYEKSLEQLGGAAAGSEFLSGNRRYVYEEVARYYARLYEAGRGDAWARRSFATVESAKARGLLDQLRQSASLESSSAEEALLDSLYTLAARAPDDTRALEALEREYQTLRAERVTRSTGALAREAGAVSLDEVMAVLDDGTVMLSYALGDTASLLWAIERDRYTLVPLAGRERMGGLVGQLRDAIGRPGSGDAALRRTARDLYVELVAPVADRLDGKKRIIVAPDGILYELPFETLLARESADGASWDELVFLGREAPMVYVPSATVFTTLKQAAGSAEYDLDLIALGDPAYASDSGLEALPYTREEVIAIAADVGDGRKKVYVGSEASESRLKALMTSTRPRILHLAAHGLVDPNDPTASSIALCEPDNSMEDGQLHTLEIASMRMRAGLVVLSACESARGRLSRSEGVVGLSRAFLASGAGGVVASLWAVSDESTSRLMTQMYAGMLAQREAAADALFDARLALIEDSDYSHPFHWAPFIAIGTDTSPW